MFSDTFRVYGEEVAGHSEEITLEIIVHYIVILQFMIPGLYTKAKIGGQKVECREVEFDTFVRLMTLF